MPVVYVNVSFLLCKTEHWEPPPKALVWASLVAQMVESASNAGDPGSIPGSGRSPGEGNGNPLQYSCLEKSHGLRSLVGYTPWDGKESYKTEQLTHTQSSCENWTWCCICSVQHGPGIQEANPIKSRSMPVILSFWRPESWRKSWYRASEDSVCILDCWILSALLPDLFSE